MYARVILLCVCAQILVAYGYPADRRAAQWENLLRNLEVRRPGGGRPGGPPGGSRQDAQGEDMSGGSQGGQTSEQQNGGGQQNQLTGQQGEPGGQGGGMAEGHQRPQGGMNDQPVQGGGSSHSGEQKWSSEEMEQEFRGLPRGLMFKIAAMVRVMTDFCRVNFQAPAEEDVEAAAEEMMNMMTGDGANGGSKRGKRQVEGEPEPSWVPYICRWLNAGGEVLDMIPEKTNTDSNQKRGLYRGRH